MPEMTIFYVNQASLNYKDNKKIYCSMHIVGQVVPMLNPPEDLENYVPKNNEAKIIRPKYDPVSGQFLGLVQTLDYLTVRGDDQECFFDYGFSKESSKVVYSTRKMKISNSFSSTIFNRYRIQFEAGALSETEFSNVFFFLPSTTDRVEEINKYMNSVNLAPIDIEISAFGETFDPSKLDYANDEKKKKKRESVLKVFKKIVDLSNSNLRKNADGLLATKTHDNELLLWVGGGKVPTGKFALSY